MDVSSQVKAEFRRQNPEARIKGGNRSSDLFLF
jgi:hypothetical protein